MIISLEDVCESHLFTVNHSRLDHDPLLANEISPEAQEQVFYVPFSNPSIYRLMRWFVFWITDKISC